MSKVLLLAPRKKDTELSKLSQLCTKNGDKYHICHLEILVFVLI